ncbi:MAG: GAF domain-containing protein [Candidatus Methylomirabilales bacterium]
MKDKAKNQLITNSQSEPKPQRSLTHIVRLLRAARFLFLFVGAIFFLWEAAEVFWEGEGVTFNAVVEVALVSVLAPLFAWVSSKWGESLARELSQSHSELLTLNQITQHEMAERRRAEESLRTQAHDLTTKTEQLEALAILGRTVSASLDLQQVLDFVVEAAVRLLNVTRSRLWLWDDAGEVLRISTKAGDPGLTPYPVRAFRSGESLVGRAFQQKETLVTDSPATDPRYEGRNWARENGIQAVAAVPLLVGERAVGALAAASRGAGSFRPEALTLLNSFAAQAAIAIENARHMHEAETRAHSLRILTDVTRVMTSSLDQGEVAESIVRAAAELLDTDLVRLWVGDEATQALYLRASHGREDLEAIGYRQIGKGQGVIGAIWETGAPAFVSDLRAEPRWMNTALLERTGLCSFAGLPLATEYNVFGVLSLLTRCQRVFTPEERELMALFADQAAISLEKARLYREVAGQKQQLEQTITERKRAEQDVQVAKDYAENLIDSSLDMTISVDVDRNIVEFNRAAQEAFGYSKEELLGKSADLLYADPSRGKRVNAALMKHGRFAGEVTNRRKNGEEFYAYLSASVIRDANGKVVGGMGVSRDITERRQMEETREALYRASLQIQVPMDLGKRLDLLLDAARTVLDLDRVNILLADPEGQWLQVVASTGITEPLGAIRVPIGPEGGGLAQAYLSQEVVVWDGRGPVPEGLRLKPPYSGIEVFRARVFANAPLVVHGRAIGILGADRKLSRRPLEPATLKLLRLFAAQAAIAIDNARLFEDIQRKAERLRVLNRLSHVVASALDTREVIHAVVQAAGQLFEDSEVNFWLVEKEGETLRLEADKSPHSHLRGHDRIQTGEGFAGWVVREKRPLLIPDVQKDRRAKNGEWHRAEGFHAFIGVPLLVGEKCLGSLNVFRRSLKAFDEEEQDVLSAFADEVAVALENARLFGQVAKGKQEWESTFDAIADGIVLLDEPGSVLRANDALASWWETRTEALMGTSWHDLWDRLGISSPCPHCEAWRKKEAVSLEAHVPATNRFVDVTVFPLNPRPSESMTGTILVMRDITERKRAEEELKATELQLIQSARLESVGRLAAGVAHEVKNPLAIIQQGLAYVAKKLVSPGDKGAALIFEKMNDAVRRADRVIRGLLDFSAPSAMDLMPSAMNAVVEESLLLVKHELIRAHVTAVKELREDLPLATLDRQKVEQVFVNLFMNAIQAMPHGGTLTVRTYARELPERAPGFGGRKTNPSRTGETVVVAEVEDTGTGIPAEKLDRIFDPFFTTKRIGEGTGLGLSVTRKIIDLHGGTIDIRNRPGGGTRVTLTFKTEGGNADAEETDPAH